MRTLRWTYVVAAIAAICLGPRAASAQYAVYRSGTGITEISTGASAYPAGTAMPVYAGPSAPAAMAVPVAQQGSCGACGCDVGCGNCGSGCEGGCDLGCGCGGDPAWRAWGDFLFLRARNQDVEYAVPLDTASLLNSGVLAQVGPTAVLNPEASAGFRIGIERALDSCSEVAVTYTYYRNENSNGVIAATPNTLEALVFQPNPSFGWSSASAHESTKFQYLDLDYRHNLWGCDCMCINYFLGMRYAEMAQEFDSTFSDGVVANMVSKVNFDGVGLRLGVDGERAFRGGFYGSAKFDANFIGGEYHALYTGVNTNLVPGAGAANVATAWSGARFTSILDAEVAIGWQSPNGRFRASIGYLLTDWCNAVRTADYINSVQQNAYHGANQLGTSSLVFDGLTGHVELAW